MSFIIANQKPTQDPAYFTTRYKNELQIPANAEIALYQAQINITPKVAVTADNNEFGILFNYQYKGFEPMDDEVYTPEEYEIIKYIDAQNLSVNICSLRHGLYTPAQLTDQLYYSCTFGDKSGMNSWTWETQYDTTSGDVGNFTGYKVICNRDTQTLTLNDSSKFVLKKLDDDDDLENATITFPDGTSVKIEKSASASDEDWDCDFLLMAPIKRNGSRIDFKISDTTKDAYFGFTRNIYDEKGFQKNWDSSSTIDLSVNNNRTIEDQLNPDELIFVGAFLDYAIYLNDGNIHILFLETLDNNECKMTEVNYWENGLAGVDNIINVEDTNDTLIRFTFSWDMVQIHFSIDAGVTYVQLIRGNEWKGISSVTSSLYPRISLNANLSAITLQCSNGSFIEPQGAINANNQAMVDSRTPNHSEFRPDNWFNLGLINWDYNLNSSMELIIKPELAVCKAIIARETLGFNNSVTDYMVSYDSTTGDIVVGSKLWTESTFLYPQFITTPVNIAADTEFGGGEPMTFTSPNYIAGMIEMDNLVRPWQWHSTPPEFDFRSENTPKNLNSKNAYVRIDNMPLETYNSSNESISRIIGVMPRFNESRATGHIYKISNPPVYVKLHNTAPIRLTELRIAIVNDDESIADDLESQTQLIFHLK
tara:strand:- start:177 stop:2126 length:1950 start_codon:yes stop_codon:yes gene_type:complete